MLKRNFHFHSAKHYVIGQRVLKLVREISDSFKGKHKNVYTDTALKEIVEKGNEADL